MLNLVRREFASFLLFDNMRVLGYINPGSGSCTLETPAAGKTYFSIINSYYYGDDSSYAKNYYLKGTGSRSIYYGYNYSTTFTVSSEIASLGDRSSEVSVLIIEVDE